MPPPAGPARLRVQIFGLERDQDTRAAVRFFKERRAEIHLVDLRGKPIAQGELRRFVERLGAASLVDTESRAYREAGMAYLRMDDAEVVERVLANPALLRLPLVRFEHSVTAGRAEETWKTWFSAKRATPGT